MTTACYKSNNNDDEFDNANDFIRPSKLPVGAAIFFICKPDSSFCL